MQEKILQPFVVTLSPLTVRILIVLFTTKAPVKIVMCSSPNECRDVTHLQLQGNEFWTWDDVGALTMPKIRCVRWSYLQFQALTNYDDPVVH